MTPRRRQNGFTLIEMMVTVGLIAVVMGVLLSQMGAGFGVHLRNASRTLAAEIQYAGQRAVATGRDHRFVIDLDAQAFRIEELPAPVEDDTFEGLPQTPEQLDLSVELASLAFQPIPTRKGDWQWLEDTEVAIDEVRIGADDIRDGAVSIGFTADGGAEPAELWLVDEAGYGVAIRLVAFTGEVRIEEGDTP